MAFRFKGTGRIGSQCQLYLDAASTRSYPRAGSVWYDLSNKINNGTLIGNPVFSTLEIDNFSFNGNNYVNCGNNASLQITQGTISAWVKTSQVTNDFRGIIAKQNNYGLFIYFGILVAYDWGNSQFRDTTISIADGIWKNVTMTFTDNTGSPSNNAIIYLNGIAVLTTTIKFLDNTRNVTIASGTSSTSQAITGNIAQATIVNRILTDVQILELYNKQKSRFGL